ncbi:MalM family protein [Vibrio sp. ZSDZ34]|jgi:maltose operon protein|uniref:MalM family protein n=1 Tax=Vibrio gelatinilyticus TaxID=2893468 RepID=A0A9X2AWQ9_9VIBR|nr:MalM family protein [Vibrio gelatinilyticus]MCJ2377620.1 MalM family protein [Vibrio gelatinilyticus]
MKFRWLPILAAISLAGCSTPQMVSNDVEPSRQVITSIDSLKWLQLDLPVDISTTLNNNSQVLLQDNIASPITGFVISGEQGSLDFKISTLVVKEKTLYASSVRVTDNQGRILAEKAFSDFNYVEAHMLDPDMYVTNFTVIPYLDSKELNVVIYTTNDDLDSTSKVTHPAKLYAKARGNHEPDIADPSIPHAPYGTVRITIQGNDVVNKRVDNSGDYTPEAASNEVYYKSAIEKAVANNDIPKALSLLDEAKALNIDGAQDVFIKAINKAK